MSGTLQTAWRVFINGRFSHVDYGETGEDVIRQVNDRVGQAKAATIEIKAYRANSASD